MNTGYSQDELDVLEREMEEHTPSIPTDANKIDAPRVMAMRASRTELGILFRFEVKEGMTLDFWFNAVVAREIGGAVNQASQAYGWAKRGLNSRSADHVEWPVPEDMGSALTVISLSTYAIHSGMLIKLVMPDVEPEGANMVFFFPVRAALEVLSTTVGAAKTAGWWDNDFELKAKRTLN